MAFLFFLAFGGASAAVAAGVGKALMEAEKESIQQQRRQRAHIDYGRERREEDEEAKRQKAAARARNEERMHQQGGDLKRVNFALVGPSGVGKTYLANSLRLLRQNDPLAGKVGVNETTMKLQRCPIEWLPDADMWDVPGAGTDRHETDGYFDRMLLDLMDFVILCYDGRWQKVCTQVVRECRKRNIPVFIVRTRFNKTYLEGEAEARFTTNGPELEATLKRELQDGLDTHLHDCRLDPQDLMFVDAHAYLVKGLVDAPNDGPRLVEEIVRSKAQRSGRSPDEVWENVKDQLTHN